MGALGDPYVTLDEMKNYLSIELAADMYDQRLTDAIDSASREIEQFTGRQFNKSATATPRIFEPDSASLVRVDDFYTTDGLLIDLDEDLDGTWVAEGFDANDFELLPLSGVVDGLPWPYYAIRSDGEFPFMGRRYAGRKGTVRVTAKWGWADVPASIKQACFLLAGQTFKLADAPFGVTGMDQFGVVRVRDLPQVASKLNRFVTVPVMVG